MSQRCKTCAHPERAEVDKAIASNVPYRTIAEQFGIPPSSITRHVKSHLREVIAEAVEVARTELIESIVKYRREVHLAPIDKVKLLQEKILNKMDTVAGEDFPALSREWRGTLDIEAKLTGSYQKDRANENDLDRLARGYRQMLNDYPNMTDEYRKNLLASFSKLSGVSEDAIMKQVRIQELEVVQ